MADGSIALRQQVAKLRKLAKLTAVSVPVVAKAVKSEIGKQVARGLGPDGKPLLLTKEGKRPLKNADGSITVGTIGSTVLVRITGHHARHHLGAVRGKVKREVIPTDKIPGPVVRAITDVLSGEFGKIMGGG